MYTNIFSCWSVAYLTNEIHEVQIIFMWQYVTASHFYVTHDSTWTNNQLTTKECNTEKLILSPKLDLMFLQWTKKSLGVCIEDNY